MCDERLFAPQIAALTKAGFNCLVGDVTKGNTYGQIAKKILHTAPSTFALAGLSMSGTLALEVIRQAPERVTHLALLNTTPKADSAGPARDEHMRRVAAGEFETIMREDYLPRYLAPTNTDVNLHPVLLQMALDLGPKVFIQQTRAMMTRASMQPVLVTITCPTLILAGREDTLCPPTLHEDMAEHVKGAMLSVVPNCGHISTLEQPAVVTEALLGLLGLR